MAKQTMEMMEMFNLISKQGLTPNQFYFLYCLRESISPIHINLHQEMRSLDGKWLTPERTLTPIAVTLIQQVEGYFKVHKKKTDVDLMGKDHVIDVDRYNLLFPRIKIPTSSKPARSDNKSVEAALRWFFQNYTYSWDTIIAATAAYVEEFEKKKYNYMCTSQYFIRKQNTDKTWKSDLADWCNMLEHGDLETEHHFKDNIV
jgi:hypothetical protein